MAGRKRKIPEGYVQKWSDSDSEMSSGEFDQYLQNFPAPQVLMASDSSTPPSAHSTPPSAPSSPQSTPSTPKSAQLPSPNNDLIFINDADVVVYPPGQAAPPEDLQQQVQGDQSDVHEDEMDIKGHRLEDDDILLQLLQEALEEEIDNTLLNMEIDEEYNDGDHENVDVEDIDEDEDEDDNEEEHEDEDDEDTYTFDDNEELEEEDQNSFQYLLKKFSEDWLMNEIDHKVSKVGTSKFWNIAIKYMFSITQAFIKEKKKKFPKFAHIRKKLKKKYVPKISIDTGYINKETNELIIASDREKLPVKEFPRDKFEKVYEVARVQVLT